MLFLLNDHVFNLGDPAETLAACGVAEGAGPMPMAQVVALGQEAAYASNNFTAAHPDLALSLAARVALACEANCALFLRPRQARGPRDVGVQFAYAPLTTMALLAQAQSRGALTAGLINAHVWSLAHAPAPA